MVGIKDFGVYIPYLRFNRADWVNVWGMKQLAGIMMGERPVANFDEDTITMSVESAHGCLKRISPKSVDGLFFASTTSPYSEKSSSAIVARTIDLESNIRSADYSGTLRCGAVALLSAIDSINAGSCNNIIVTTADIRLSEPKFYMETMMGDSSAALLIGKDDVICEIEGSVSLYQEFTDVWRRREDKCLKYDDEKYSNTYGILQCVPQVIKSLMGKYNLKSEDISKIVSYAPEAATYMALAKRSGFPMLWNADPLLLNVGNAGSASAFLQLALVLEEANPGDRIIMVSYGDGADAFLLKVTDKISKIKGGNGIRRYLDSKKQIDSYIKILQYRGLLKSNNDSIWDFDPFSSIAMLKKQEKQVFALYGKKCECGAIIYPIKRVCPKCKEKDKGKEIKLNHTGKVFSFVADNVFPNPEIPVVMAVIDLDGGGRLLTQLTDVEDGKVEIGMPVELTFRKFHEAKGFNNYYWKARPVR